MQSNEPLVIQAIEEAILYRQYHIGMQDGLYILSNEDAERIREYRKLLQRARGRTIERIRNRRQKIQKRVGVLKNSSSLIRKHRRA